MERRRRSVGTTILSIILGWLGVAGVLNALGWPLLRNSELIKSAPPAFIARSPDVLGSWWLAVLCLAYGISALLAARALWRLAPSATMAYVGWAITVVLIFLAFFVTTPGVPFKVFVGSLLPVLGLLLVGGLYVRRLVQA